MKRILLLAGILPYCMFTMAQDALTNMGNLQVHSGASLFGYGHFSNTSSGSLVNNGSLYVRGNITNDQSSMSAGTGTLHINGSSAQSVNGTQPFRAYHLVSNNAAGITLNNNLSISGTHTFTSGIITTSITPNYLVYEDGSSYSGNGDARHVNGWVKKFGASDFIFPVGNGTVERTVTLSGLSGASEFNARYLATTPNTSQTQIPVRDVNDFEYWAINKPSGGSASVTLNWDASKVYFPNWIIADIVTAGYNGTAWTDNGGTASGNAATTGTITSSSISSFNLFTFGSKSWVLALSLNQFTASRKEGYSLIEWETEKELNLRHFEVERSDNGSAFYTIARVAARNSGNQEQYQIKDHAPLRHIAYYRLRTTDADGKETFSRIVVVTEKNSNDLLLLTNPVRHKITLVATSQLSGEFRFQISKINGQLVQQGTIIIHHGGQYDIILNGNLQPGTYSLKVAGQSQIFNYKILVL